MEYNFSEIEKKWQAFWAKEKTFAAEDHSSKPKYYVLDMFPYPSGAGLHVGHPLGYIASDIVARYKRHKGFNVLHPMGYDSFGLPAEQYAIQTGQHPAITTENNINRYREQLDKIGFSFDWDREVRTSDPEYYKWTQWIFIKLFHCWYNPETNKAEPIKKLVEKFNAEGSKFGGKLFSELNEKEKSDVLMDYRLAYLSEAMVNWCPALGTVLANEEVKDGVSERGGYPVERKLMPQWSLRITAYADRLLNDLEGIDWSESIKEAQRNWIGKSEGCSLRFTISGLQLSDATENSKQQTVNPFIEVFTTRPDTIFGVSFVTLAPEHEMVEKIATPEYKKLVEEYVTAAKNRSERERMADVKKVTGQFTGAYVLHPFSGKQIPIWIGDYVLAGYGTGAVMGVPAHDSRDFAFAKHFDLERPTVILPSVDWDFADQSYDEKIGKCVNSDFLNGLEVKAAIKKCIEEIEKRGLGKGKTNYRLRDAIFGRQRYWGEPIPVYYNDGIPHTMEESELPLVLPEVDKYLPTETGEPPLARASNWTYKASSQPSPSEREQSSFPYQTADKKSYPHLKEYAKENRREATKAEDLMWEELRNNKIGHKIRRQHAIGTFIADFVSIPKKLVIEIDGSVHTDERQKEYDEQRTILLNEFGYEVIRFTNSEVLADSKEVASKIKSTLDSKVLSFGEDLGEADTEIEYPLETTTMPGWAGSSWYFLRYMDAKNKNEFASKDAVNYWKEVDLYIGGSEHATGHLLYVRFWTKFLFDLGYIPVIEPAKKLINQGMIQGLSAKARIVQYFDDEIKSIRRIILPDNYPFDLIEGSYSTINYPVEYLGFASIGSEKTYYQLFNERHQAARKQHLFLQDIEFSSKNSIKKFYQSSNPNFNEQNENTLNNFLNKFDIETIILLKTEVEKMSKSKYNVVTPDGYHNENGEFVTGVLDAYGADCLRMYEMFLGPLEQSKPWSPNGVSGVSNFIRKFWRLYHTADGKVLSFGEDSGEASKAELKALHKTIKKITEDIENYSFNTSISAFMICVNELSTLKCNKREILEPLVIIISPYAPHIAEELWNKLGHKESVEYAAFPSYKEEYIKDDAVEYPVSINGKTRFKLSIAAEFSKEQVEKEVMSSEEMKKYLNGNTPKKVIVVPGRIVNIVL